MTSFPGSPKLLKCGIVLIDPATARCSHRFAAIQSGIAEPHSSAERAKAEKRSEALWQIDRKGQVRFELFNLIGATCVLPSE